MKTKILTLTHPEGVQVEVGREIIGERVNTQYRSFVYKIPNDNKMIVVMHIHVGERSRDKFLVLRENRLGWEKTIALCPKVQEVDLDQHRHIEK